MAVKTFNKPNWYNSADVVPAKHGWIHEPTNEVLAAIPHLDVRLAAEDDETTVPNAPAIKVINSLTIKLSGIPNASYSLTVGSGDPFVGTFGSNGSDIIQLNYDLIENDIITAYQTDEDDNDSDTASFTVKKLKGKLKILSWTLSSVLDISLELTNIIIGEDAPLTITCGELEILAEIDDTNVNIASGVKTVTLSEIDYSTVEGLGIGPKVLTIAAVGNDGKPVSITLNVVIPEQGG